MDPMEANDDIDVSASDNGPQKPRQSSGKRRREGDAESATAADDDAVGAAPAVQKEEEGYRRLRDDLPLELAGVDFTERVAWDKYRPYSDRPLPLVPVDAAPIFGDKDGEESSPSSSSPALCHYVHAVSGRARACTLHLKQPPPASWSSSLRRHENRATIPSRPVQTPMFMPVGTKGCLKGVSLAELCTDTALACPIILANTYHLAIQPGTEAIRDMGGLHAFQGLDRMAAEAAAAAAEAAAADAEAESKAAQCDYPAPTTNFHPYNILTDSGGFQMVSLLKLSRVTEEGVSFENPFTTKKTRGDSSSFRKGGLGKEDRSDENEAGRGETGGGHEGIDTMLLRPEDSIRHQNNIGANIIMALDDVVSSVAEDSERFRTATHRTLRWYDRCREAHARADSQSLFPIVQGGLDVELGGLREQCLAGFRLRDDDENRIPGFAIGGLAGGESKDRFWRVVDQCCRALPDDRPRYLMGVGYPLDLVVCTALGVDLYDCVYPTRTARFGAALVPGRAPGTLKLKARECFSSEYDGVIQRGCPCQACREGISRARLHLLFRGGNPLAVELLTQHNLAYMMALVRDMRRSILDDRFADFALNFVREQYPGKNNGGENVPKWVADALAATGIHVPPNH